MSAKRKLAVCAALGLLALYGPVQAGDMCAARHTIEEGVLTVATGNPAYFPWVIDDAPEAGEGFEAEIAYAVAGQMGFDPSDVVWTRATFDQSIQPGEKDFDFNLQQFSITSERDRVVDFSVPYYAAPMAVLTRRNMVDQGLRPELPALKGILWGVSANTTALEMVGSIIQPEQDALLYDDLNDVVAALRANQVDAALFDLPTALYISAAVLEDSVVLGQFPADRSENPDRFGLLMAEGNPLKACVDAAIVALRDSGRLAEIERRWLADATGVPVIK